MRRCLSLTLKGCLNAIPRNTESRAAGVSVSNYSSSTVNKLSTQKNVLKNVLSKERSLKSSRRFFATYDRKVKDDDRVFIEPESDYVPHVGFDLMMDRATKIMNALAQRDFFLVLQTHCNTKLPGYLEGKTNYDLHGCTDNLDVFTQSKSVFQYSAVELVDYSDPKGLPYTSNSHNFVIHMLPCPDPDPPLDPLNPGPYIPPKMVDSPPFSEVFRIVAEKGYCVIGAPKQIWESHHMLDQIFELEEQREVSFCSLQMLPLDRPVDFSFQDYGVEGERSQNDIDWDTKEEMYYICLVRKI